MPEVLARRELAMARWGMPSPKQALEGKRTDPGVTNVRNTKSSHWRRWLEVESRCLIPFTSFSEPEPQPDGRRPPAWFALDESRPLTFFASIWVPKWKSVRKLKEGEIEADLFAVLTTEPNAEVGAIHPKAMPVILTKPDELAVWLTQPWKQAKVLQRPLPDSARSIVLAIDTQRVYRAAVAALGWDKIKRQSEGLRKRTERGAVP